MQMTYYLLLIVLIYGVIQLQEALKNKTVPELLKTVGLLAVAVLLAVSTFFAQFWALQEYSAYSTRGPSDLVATAGEGNKDAVGMSKEYAFEFSNGILEPLTLLSALNALMLPSGVRSPSGKTRGQYPRLRNSPVVRRARRQRRS